MCILTDTPIGQDQRETTRQLERHNNSDLNESNNHTNDNNDVSSVNRSNKNYNSGHNIRSYNPYHRNHHNTGTSHGSNRSHHFTSTYHYYSTNHSSYYLDRHDRYTHYDRYDGHDDRYDRQDRFDRYDRLYRSNQYCDRSDRYMHKGYPHHHHGYHHGHTHRNYNTKYSNTIHDARQLKGNSTSEAKAPKTTQIINGAEVECCPSKLAARAKQIGIAKFSIGYKNYRRMVPADERDENHPQTPKLNLPTSKRTFWGLLSEWKKQLHEYDDVVFTGPEAEEEAETGEVILFRVVQKQD